MSHVLARQYVVNVCIIIDKQENYRHVIFLLPQNKPMTALSGSFWKSRKGKMDAPDLMAIHTDFLMLYMQPQ